MWTCNLFQITTGLIGPRLNFEAITWGIELNGTETWSVDLKKSDLPLVDYRYWLAPWWVGIVFFYNNKPIIGGPLVNLPSESFTELKLSGLGIRGILARRKVTQEIFGPDWTSMPQTEVNLTNRSLGTIAKEAVKISQQKKGGALPISYPVPSESGTHMRNYMGFNVSNINTDQVLTKLANVRNGPDILFRPRVTAASKLTFDMWHGTNDNPRIQQSTDIPTWDMTPEKGSMDNFRLTTTGAYQSFRVYSSGAGTDKGIKMDVITNDEPLSQGFPLLETSISTSKSEQIEVVRAHGIANLQMNSNKLQEVEMHVRADGTVKLGSFWPGNLVYINVKGFVTLKDGFHPMRLLAMSGTHDQDVMLNLQSEEKFISTQGLESLTEDDENVS